jgi:small nuclear ribonucleoprotein (snRNP)-like protein
MAGWIYYLDKKVWIVLKNKKEYSGKVIDVDSSSSNLLTWITIIDKHNRRVCFCTEEISLIKEEEDFGDGRKKLL